MDVAYPENADFIRIAMVARDARGVTIWLAQSEIVRCPQPLEGEALAVIFDVHRAIQQGWRIVIIETDCLPVHQYLIQNPSSLLSFGVILDDCFVSRIKFQPLLFSFVKRQWNEFYSISS